MKTIQTRKEKTSLEQKDIIKGTMISKIFSYWMGKYEIPELSDEANNFILKELWRFGSVAIFKAPEYQEGDDIDSVIACPYSPSEFNIYNYPTRVNLVALRGAKFIPASTQVINKDVCIIYGHVSHMAVKDMVEFYVDRIADIEMTINNHLFLQKMPRLIPVSPEDRARADSLIKAIDRGEKRLFLDVNDMNSLNNVLDSGGTYIIDKLYILKQNYEEELLTFLGIDNKGINKQERLLVDEVNANNQSIIEGGDNFAIEIKRGLENISKYLNVKLTLKELHEVSQMVEGNDKIEDEEEDSTHDNLQ